MSDFFISCVFKIILSFIAGFVFGLERKFRQQVVGMRTLILICCSSAMLSILSEWIAIQSGAADTARIAAGVISGIGFLGAGVIMKTGLNVKGLTSAAVIWADSTIGLCRKPSFFNFFEQNQRQNKNCQKKKRRNIKPFSNAKPDSRICPNNRRVG